MEYNHGYTVRDLREFKEEIDKLRKKLQETSERKIDLYNANLSPYPTLTQALSNLEKAVTLEKEGEKLFPLPSGYANSELLGLLGNTQESLYEAKEELNKIKEQK